MQPVPSSAETGPTAPVTSSPDAQHLMHSLTFEQLHTLRTIAGVGSFHEAAKILCLTQPAISQRVKNLERTIGAAVFERHSGVGVTLTPVGETVLDFCDRSIRHLDEFSAQLEALHKPPREAELGIVAPSDLIQYVLIPALPNFQRLHPELAVRLRQSSDRRDSAGLLAGGKADLAFDRSPAHTSLTPLARMTEELHLVVPAGHDLLRLPPAQRPAAVSSFPFATYAPGMRSYDLVRRWAERAGAAVAPQVESRSVQVMKESVLRHGMIALLPVTAVTEEVAAGSLCLAEVPGLPLLRSTVVATRPDKAHDPRIRLFVEELAQLHAEDAAGASRGITWVLAEEQQPAV
ncbi:LysR family transcriptional regulator [Streptomyces sp. CA2R106]|uniref:LysR family transcriptional regulator n=1 Tax=Streptomyces sp. CA2R106 TaxID=3120153 RepID=UPI00300B925B